MKISKNSQQERIPCRAKVLASGWRANVAMRSTMPCAEIILAANLRDVNSVA
jgi:hypothetical protein